MVLEMVMEMLSPNHEYLNYEHPIPQLLYFFQNEIMKKMLKMILLMLRIQKIITFNFGGFKFFEIFSNTTTTTFITDFFYASF